MDRHVPMHCVRKHLAGAGIHAQEVYEKAMRDGVVDPKRVAYHIKVVKSLPVVLEEQIVLHGEKNIDELLNKLGEAVDIVRELRQEALTWIPVIAKVGEGKLETWQRAYIQEIMEYAGELWQVEKHLMEYIAHLSSSRRGET